VEQEAGGGEEGKQRSVGGLHVDNEEKMDSLQLEYTYLLTSQVPYHLLSNGKYIDELRYSSTKPFYKRRYLFPENKQTQNF